MNSVLVVEDDWMHRDFLVRLLQIKGYTVQSARDGEAAIGALEARVPDAVVLDLGLPGINGYQLARLIRTRPATAHLPIIALTAYARDEDHHRALLAGCDAFETKPVDLESLASKLQQLIGQRRACAI